MKINKLTCSYYPTTVLFLDDSVNFLKAIEFELSSDLKIKAVMDVEGALKKLKENQSYLDNLASNSDNLSDDSDNSENTELRFSINDIHNALYCSLRHNEISVAVIDQNMPLMTGIEFCKKTKDFSPKKMILTSEDDKAMAVSAFNNGLINQFVLKNNNDLHADLLESIRTLQNEYFFTKYKHIYSNLSEKLRNLFESEEYINLFNKVLKEAGAVEYYLMDKKGAFLILNSAKEPTWFVIKSQNECQEQADMLESLGGSADLVKNIEKGQKILFLLTESDHKKSLVDWNKNIFSSERLNDSFVYSIIKDKVNQSINWEDIK